MNPITKLTTLTLISALAVTGARAGSAEEAQAKAAGKILGRTYRYAERQALKAAYDKYRSGIRLADYEAFTRYVNTREDRPIDPSAARPVGDHDWERQYEQLESEARVAAKNAVREAFQKGLAVAKRAAMAEARRAIGPVDWNAARIRNQVLWAKVHGGLSYEKAHEIAEAAARKAREQRLAEVAAEILERKEDEVRRQAMRSGFEVYAAAEESAYRQGKWYFNQAVPMHAPEPEAVEVEEESEPEVEEEAESTEPGEEEAEVEAPVLGPARPDEAWIGFQPSVTRSELAHGAVDLTLDGIELFSTTIETGQTAARFAGQVASVGILGFAEEPLPAPTEPEMVLEPQIVELEAATYGLPTASHTD